MKLKTILTISLAVIMCSVGVVAAGCSKDKNMELPAYCGEQTDVTGEMLFNEDIFYRNDNKGIGPDPFIFKDPQSDYYYAYSTLGYMFAYRSNDLAHWESVGHVLDVFGDGEEKNVVKADRWAPEVVYDAEARDGQGEYYIYFSASPKDGGAHAVMYMGKSDSPEGPFALVNFKDNDSCDGNVHDYDAALYNDYFAKYLLFDPAKFAEVCEPLEYNNFKGGHGECQGYLESIDPHPYVDPIADENGVHKKYMYFCGNGMRPNRLFAVEMENWSSPKWDTFKEVLYYGFYDEQSFKDAYYEGYYTDLNGTDNYISQIPYESEGVVEGPTVVHNSVNGKYYLTYSTGAYQNNSYQVAQAVGDTPMGPFRKLTLAENGCFLSGMYQGGEDVSGSGHHGMFAIDNKLYAVYHRHNNPDVGGDLRNAAIDEVTWITVKDPNGNDLLAMYTNGPTTTIQPRIYGSKYKNIAGEAKSVSGGKLESGSKLEYLTDGLLSSYYRTNDGIDANVFETYLTETSTIEFNFETERTVRAIMVYDSKDGETAFRNISRIEILSEGINYVVQNVKLSETLYTLREFDNAITYISPCAAAFAEFDEIKTTRVRITIEVSQGQSKVGLSEVRILGI